MKDNVVLSGRLDFLSLGDLLQLLGFSDNMGVLRLINRYAPHPGFIYFVDGKPVNATNGKLEGLDALYSFFGWVGGAFEFTRETVFAEEKITESRMGIILEGMKRLDDGLTKIVGPGAIVESPGESGIQSAGGFSGIIKGPLVDYMYVVDEEDFFDGDYISEEGKHGGWMWVVLEGVVDFVKQTPSGDVVPILRVGDGAFIGSIASFLIQEHIRSISAVAVGNVQLGVLDSQRLTQEYAGISQEFKLILSNLDKRFKQLIDRIFAYKTGNMNGDDILKNKKILVPQGKKHRGQLFMIKQGRAAIAKITPNGPVPLGQLSTGDFFGDLPFLRMGQEPHGAAIYASENIKVAKMELPVIEREYGRLSTTFKNIADNLASCIAVATDKIADAASDGSHSTASDAENEYREDK